MLKEDNFFNISNYMQDRQYDKETEKERKKQIIQRK